MSCAARSTLGINFIDTAWYYGPLVSNRLIAEALHPYPRDLVIATKLGGKRLPDKGWASALRPEELRKGAEDDLRTLRLERLDVVHLRYMAGAGVPLPGVARRAGGDAGRGQDPPPRRSATSACARSSRRWRARPSSPCRTCSTCRAAAGRWRSPPTPRSRRPRRCSTSARARNIAYLPFFPLAVGNVAQEKPALAAIAGKHGATPAQIALAWLLARSPVMLPIPGTSSLEHLEENWDARRIELSREEVAAIAKQA